eukprot:14681844-Alexandrium_andersonii.AAC.1
MGHYSGYESMPMALNFLVKELQSRGYPAQQPVNLHASDCDPFCRKILCATDERERAQCVF